MDKDRALTRAFELVETLDLTNLTALQVVQTVNLIAEEFLEVFAEGEQKGWKGLGTTPKMPHEVLRENKLRATWPIEATEPEGLTPGEIKALDPNHEWYPTPDGGPRRHFGEPPTHKYTRTEERSEG